METLAAVLWDRNVPWSIETIELDPPGPEEVQVELHASGMCHSDDHIVTGDMPFHLPCIGGHEGAGVVTHVGEKVTSVAPGDHVVFSFMPSCGRCPSCSTGHQSLCDLGERLYTGRQIADGTARHHARGQDVATACLIGSFAHHTVVHESSCVKIHPDVPLDRACLLGCGFITGWGSAVYAADVAPGDTVAVAGIGGIGAAAIQGARLAGARVIVAIDPSAAKKDVALSMGATHVAGSWDEAPAVVQEATYGRGVDRFISTMGRGEGRLISKSLAMTAKRGRLVVTNIHPAAERSISVSLMDLTLNEKQIVGTLYGSANPRADIPKVIDLWVAGQVDLDAVVSKTYSLDEINEGYADMRTGNYLRGVLRYPAAG
ncbi:NDMA-dependent alcohol dehydrogenase [Cryptosporangium aurantiacum]|uniref:S-(Hydroxymethyl)glutathione dehydrogenase / alcohol dehydrogenase n=1 Tax=Cryptosporangium aurantiacum TaxID=134849 RepID=A0A1M7PLY9_9ACTN|nr:NDMA-dependent alcohol dehydrogenase [Cryptosporangium aurantiacum]SHN18069.1 S-(hydroxymethyl)glutathione dehydrogenase / alcohol dehydrogenase [Cryptosporangium aurantiacum]